MKRSAGWLYRWIFNLAAGFLFGATVLRSLLRYRDSPELGQVLGLLTIWLILLVSVTPISRRWPAYFWIYLILQIILVVTLLLIPGYPDYFAILFGILSMQIMQRFGPRSGALWIGLFALLTIVSLVKTYGASQAIAFALIFTAINALLGSFALTTQRAQAARAHNQALAQEWQETNRQLQAYSKQVEQLVVARERHHLARELHDSVTQTIFSMTLTAQSALLLLKHDPKRVSEQLDRLNQLSQSALSEMRVLISKLRPEKMAEGDLAAALRLHLVERHLPENLVITLEVEGGQSLAAVEEQSLFRITQEALNNIVKHAQASQARIRLHLVEPLWIEIEDHGRGFDVRQVQNSSRVGLISMRERAAEIGWNLQINSSPGAGTRIRVEKKPPGERST